MPNIGIHGYGHTVIDNPQLLDNFLKVCINKKAFKVKERIDEVMQKIGLRNDAVTTIHPSIAQTCDGKKTPAPYLIISNSEPEKTEKIIQALKDSAIIMDVETLTLSGFIPAKDMQ